MNDSEGAALFAAIQENPADLAPHLIYSDWLEENGRWAEALAWRGQLAKSHPLGEFYWGGHGSGIEYGLGTGEEAQERGSSGRGWGYGEGDVQGYGSGYEAAPNGGVIAASFGSVDGSGEGHAYGPGDKDGLGSGEGFRFQDGDPFTGYQYFLQTEWKNRHKSRFEEKPMIGKKMLLWCGRGFAWIGLVEEMYAPGCYKLSNAGMLCHTGSNSWLSVESGKGQYNYVYRHAPDGIVYTGSELHGAVEWKNELPGRDIGWRTR